MRESVRRALADLATSAQAMGCDQVEIDQVVADLSSPSWAFPAEAITAVRGHVQQGHSIAHGLSLVRGGVWPGDTGVRVTATKKAARDDAQPTLI